MTATSPDFELRLLSELRSLSRHLDRALAPSLKSRIAVDDLVQETFLRAWQAKESLRATEGDGVLAWLKQIAHRIVIDRIRLKSYGTTTQESGPALVTALARSGWLTASQQFSRFEVQALVLRAMLQLETMHQTVLQLRYVEQLSFVEIAARLGQTSGAVRGLHRTAKRQLQEFLGRASLYLSGTSPA